MSAIEIVQDCASTPLRWMRMKKLRREFWQFFWAAFFFDFGFAVYFFLFNLYLLDLRFDERGIGLIGSALTLGSVAGTLPAGWLSRKVGLWPLLVACFAAAPLAGILRAMLPGEVLQLVLAFLAGMAMCLWGVCFSPAIAHLSSEENRAFAFGLIFSVSIGTSAIGGVICGYLPRWLNMAGVTMSTVEVKRLILLCASLLATIGVVFILKLRGKLGNSAEPAQSRSSVRDKLWLSPFLLRFLPAMGLWSAVLAAFTSFANVYLTQVQRFSLQEIGLLFSVAQVLQFSSGLVAPWLFRRLGLVRGIVVTQLVTAISMGALAITGQPILAAGLYLVLAATQWMCSPGLYSLLMDRTAPADRGKASSLTIFCNSVLQTGANALAGICLVRFGYPPVMVTAMVGIFGAAILFSFVVAPVAHEPALVAAEEGMS